VIIKWPKNKNVGDVYTSPTGSKWKWNGKAWTSFREAGTATIFQGTSHGVTYQFSHSPMDPVDNMSYYIGDISDSPAQSNGSISSKRVKSLIGGKVRQVNIMTQILNQLGSSESQTFTLKNHTKGTSAVITSDYRNLTNSQLDNFVLDTPLDVSSNDELYIVWTVTNFSISPISVRHNFNIYIE
jgi:hypothetical protein